MSSPNNNLMPLAIAAAVGAALSWGAHSWLADDSAQLQQISALQNKILDLEILLAQQEEALKNNHSLHFGDIKQTPSMAQTTSSTPRQVTASTAEGTEHIASGTHQTATAPNVDQTIKDLLTLAYGDPRNFHEKVNDFLAENPGKEGVAIASKGVFDLADNRDVLPDHSLESIYLDQKDPDFRRVLAQVASMRGDNSLMERQITEMQSGLKSNSPSEKQKALVALGKTRYAGAANAIVPLLRDSDIGVKLDALLALRNTGNQSHLRYVEELVNHPNESVSWLAKDVVNNLQILSDVARTRVNGNDLAAELPPIQGQL